MTEKLTIKDLNCGNCTNTGCEHYAERHTYRSQLDRDGHMASSACLTGDVGCASHPLALQVLAAPVIEELGKDEKEQIEIYQNATTMNEEVYHQGIVFGIQRAAKLLKEGVKKP